ncbi:MAG TPA: hypothetical protein V6D05_18780 [Stenomitos sp.]
MMKVLAKLNNATGLLKYLLLLSFYYLAYRYPFQINSAETSPTYSDTPFALQALKYLLFFLICTVFFLNSVRGKRRMVVSREHLLDFLFFGVVFALPIGYSLLTSDTVLLQTGIFFGALLLYFISRRKEIDILQIRKWISVFLGLSIVVELIQLALYFGTGRLPALGYPNSISLRFGSIWDDPNGFAFMICFFIPFVLAKRMKLAPKVMLTSVLLIMLVLTQSLTGIFALAVALIVGVFLLGVLVRKRQYWLQGFSLLGLYVMGMLFVVTVVLNLPIIKHFLELKSGSIDDHIEMMGLIQKAKLLNYVGLNPVGMIAETGYINIVCNFGLVYLVLYVAMLAYAAFRLIRKIRDNVGRQGVEVYYGAFFFVLSFAFGMGNLPLDTVFPLNLILVACIMLSYNRAELVPATPAQSDAPLGQRNLIAS